MPIYSGPQRIEELHALGVKIGEGWVWNGTQWTQVYSSSGWMVTDNFDRADIAELTAPWVKGSSAAAATMGITSGRAVATGINQRGRYIYPVQIGLAQQAEALIHNAGLGACVVLRADLAVDSSCVFAGVYSDRAFIGSFAAGATNPTTNVSTPFQAVTGDIIRGEVDELGKVSLFINDVPVLTYPGTTATGSYAGLRVVGNTSGAAVESWRAGRL